MVGKAHFGPVPDSFDVQRIISGEKGGDPDDFYAQHIRQHGFGRSSAHPNPIPPELFMDAFLADTTIAEIDEVRKRDGGPFFALCSMPSPHSPIDPPGNWAELYSDTDLPALNYSEGEVDHHPAGLRRLVGTMNPEATAAEPRSGYTDGEFEHLREAVGNTVTGRDPAEIDRYRKLYYGLAAYCDHQVGRLLDYLDSSGLRSNTLVIFTSDHGFQLFDHGFNDKHNFYDESWRVPFILSQPGVLPEGARRDFATWNDITATILAAAGAEHDWVQGFDLYSPLSADQPSPRGCAVASVYRSMAVATKRWKLVYYIDEDEGRLFDRLNDPAEQMDLYDDPRYADVRDTMRHALLAWRGDIADISYLHRNTAGGGPVAKRVERMVRSMTGQDSERRLSKRLEGIDELQP
jgi:arylsulfatase A-like enzyme